MKKIKALSVISAVTLAVVPVSFVFASEISSSRNSLKIIAEPTPAPAEKTNSVKNAESNTPDSLISETSDYDGRIKTQSYNINGDEWTVVMKIGESFANEELPEGFSEYEVVYQKTFPSEIQ